MGFVEDDLPKECLTKEELTLLLDVFSLDTNIYSYLTPMQQEEVKQ